MIMDDSGWQIANVLKGMKDQSAGWNLVEVVKAFGGSFVVEVWQDLCSMKLELRPWNLLMK